MPFKPQQLEPKNTAASLKQINGEAALVTMETEAHFPG